VPVFLVASIENNKQNRSKQASALLTRYETILREQVEAQGGQVVGSDDHGTLAVFDGGEPLLAALEIQRLLAREDWGPALALRPRLALHAGEAEQREGEWAGSVVRRAWRLGAVGWGGQILLTPEVMHCTTLPNEATLEDLGIHLLKDLGQPQKIYGLVHNDLSEQFPPLRSLTGRPNNLPTQPTPFVGREEELARIAQMLDDPTCRLLTMIGSGGMGKTRLALHAAAEKIDDFSHGVFFVALAPVSSPDFLVSTVATALGFSFYSQENPKVQLLNYLSEKEMLLVVDNFEHMMSGVSLIAEILRAAPDLKVLTTSRERLNLPGEWTFEVEGMRVPEHASDADFEEYSAVQLFLQSARRVQPGFEPDDKDKAAIIHICRLVEGIPLGIELAASWVRMLSCTEIMQEIQGNLDFLETTMRDLPARHRSLRGVFDYSWVLLSDEEQRVFRKLAVFRGGFRREAGVRVAGASQSSLSTLVDKSLLRQNSAGRYEMHEILRQYAAERLEEVAREEASTRDFHCSYYAEFLQARARPLKGGKQREALLEIGEELENIRAAWARAIERNKGDELGKALESLYRFYDLRGLVQEGEETLGRAVEVLRGGARSSLRGAADPGTLGKLLARQGEFASRLGLYGKARELLQESLRLAREQSAEADTVFALNILGDVARTLGEYDEARDFLREGLALAVQIKDLHGQARALNNLGIVAGSRGEAGEAKQLFSQAIELCKTLEDRRGVSKALSNLGIVAYLSGEYEQAKPLLQESLRIYQELGDQVGIANCLNNLGLIASNLKEHTEAKELHRKSLAIFREIGSRYGIGLNLNDLGTVAYTLGEYGESKASFHEALKTALDMGVVPMALDALVGMAMLLIKEEQGELACQLLTFANNHPASNSETKARAKQLLAELEAQLPPDTFTAAQTRAEGQELEAVARGVLGKSRIAKYGRRSS
jgi:predicted ATPase/uncharacterized protein HemY